MKRPRIEEPKSRIPRITDGARYVYLAGFFALLSGFFHPLISGTAFNPVITGVLVLFVGLAGGALVYRGAYLGKNRGILMGAGLGLIALSLLLIMQII